VYYRKEYFLIETNTVIMYDVFALGNRCNSNVIANQFFFAITFIFCHFPIQHVMLYSHMLSEVVIKVKRI
jgi:hypothetical protein